MKISDNHPTFWKKYITGYKSFMKLEKGLSENSISAYIRDLKKLINYSSEHYADILPENLTSEMLSKFIQDLANSNIAESSQSRIISGIRTFYTYLIIEDKLNENPADSIELPRISQKIPTILSQDEIEALINAIDLSKPEGHRNKAIIETLYGCGLRATELINLKISDLYFKEGFIKVTGKGNKERIIPIGKSSQKAINFYIKGYRNKQNINPQDADILFLSRKGKKLTRITIFTITKELSEKIGLQKNISPHTFRHSFASHLVDGGADIRAVQQMLGHESIVTTEIYTHIDNDFLRSEIIDHHPRS